MSSGKVLIARTEGDDWSGLEGRGGILCKLASDCVDGAQLVLGDASSRGKDSFFPNVEEYLSFSVVFVADVLILGCALSDSNLGAGIFIWRGGKLG